jgi:hypothetical protein
MKRVGVLSVVDRPRPGLMDHSDAFAALAKPYGYDVTCMHLAAASKTWGFWGLVKACRHNDLLLIWSFGLTIALLPIIRLLAPGLKVAFVYHEPGGLRQKLRKKDPLFPSIVSALLERVAISVSHQVLIPREDKVGEFQHLNAIFAPLLYDACACVKKAPVASASILYLGRRDLRRKFDLFCDDGFRRLVSGNGSDLVFQFFPGDDGDFSCSAKIAAIRKASVIMNIYTVPYNQSGVTVEALVHGAPVVVSTFDPYAKQLSSLGLVVSPSASDSEIAATLRHAIANRNDLSPLLTELGSDLGGVVCFERYWDKWMRPLFF